MTSPRFILCLAGVLCVTACGGDDDIAGNSGDPLEPAEAAAVLLAISQILGDAVLDFGGGPTSAAAVVPVNETFSVSAACPLGGSLALSGRIRGDVDDDRGTADLDFDFTETIRACRMAHEATQFTINGAPELRYRGSLFIAVSENDLVFNGEFDLDGGLAWSASDGRAGTCRVDVHYAYSTNRVSATGSVCGESVNTTVSL